MTRKSIVLALAILALAAVTAFANYPGDPIPAGAQDPTTLQLENGNWVPATYAYTFNSISASSNGKSNVEVHSFDIVNHVSVAQWVDYSISGTRKDWRILRPGIYASNSVTAQISSNNDVLIEFWATDPEYLDDINGGTSVTSTIPKWFGYSSGISIDEVEANGWLRVDEYDANNPYLIRLEDSAGLHNELTFKIWEKIEVVPSNSSSDYEGTGNVTIRLTNMKHWVDPEAGTFYAGGYGPLDPDW